MLFSISFRSVRLISVYCLNLVTSVLSCNTVYTYTAVCKYLFVFIYILSLFVYIFHFLDYAPGGGQIHLQLQSLVSLLPFVPTLKDSRHGFCQFPTQHQMEDSKKALVNFTNLDHALVLSLENIPVIKIHKP